MVPSPGAFGLRGTATAAHWYPFGPVVPLHETQWTESAEVPDVEVPDVEVPDVEVPDVEVPDVEVPVEELWCAEEPHPAARRARASPPTSAGMPRDLRPIMVAESTGDRGPLRFRHARSGTE